MDGVTLAFLIVGGCSVAVLLISVVVGDIAQFAVGADADGPFSLPAIAAFFGGGGFAGAIAASAIGDSVSTSARLLISLAIAVAFAVPLTWATLRLASTLMNLRTDETLTSSSILGAHGVVVTSISSATSFGEVRLTVGGHTLKFNARSQQPLPVGTPVYVIDVPSSTSVEVVSTAFDTESE